MMPSLKEMCVKNCTTTSSSTVTTDSAAIATTSQDYFTRDMENLVSEIKENLKLSNFKVKHQRKINRPKPYCIPNRSLNDSECESCQSCSINKSATTICKCSHSSHIATSKSKESSTDDPYEMLQELLKDGSLIKEAVRRLQKGLSPKQRYFYESEDDSRSSPLPNLDFVC